MGRREAGQHRPAPPHQARRPLILRPKGTRVSPAMGPLGGYQPGTSSSRQERKSRSPASIKENTTPATSYPMLWSRQHGPRPPPHLPGLTGSPPDLQAQQQCPLPTPRGTQEGPRRDQLWTFVLQHSVNLFHRGDRVLRSVGGANGRRQDTQGNASRLCWSLQRAPCSPAQRRPSKGSLKPGQQGGGGACSLAPGAHAVWTPGRGGQQPRPSS